MRLKFEISTKLNHENLQIIWKLIGLRADNHDWFMQIKYETLLVADLRHKLQTTQLHD